MKRFPLPMLTPACPTAYLRASRSANFFIDNALYLPA